MPRNTELFGFTCRGESIVRLDDVRQGPSFGRNAPYYSLSSGRLSVASYLAAPVVLHSDEVLGGLFFGHPAPGVFTERTERLVEGLAAMAAVALDNARLYREGQEGGARATSSSPRRRDRRRPSAIASARDRPAGVERAVGQGAARVVENLVSNAIKYSPEEGDAVVTGGLGRRRACGADCAGPGARDSGR